MAGTQAHDSVNAADLILLSAGFRPGDPTANLAGGYNATNDLTDTLANQIQTLGESTCRINLGNYALLCM